MPNTSMPEPPKISSWPETMRAIAEYTNLGRTKDIRMDIRHILIPVDFSEFSDQALGYAISLASDWRAHLTLIHVMHALPMGGADMGRPYLVPYQTALEEEAHCLMDNLLEVVQAAGMTGDSVLAHGLTSYEIIHTAKALKVDLIVMGSHGRTGLPRVLLSSVAEKVVRLAPCPVLVVRQCMERPSVDRNVEHN